MAIFIHSKTLTRDIEDIYKIDQIKLLEIKITMSVENILSED